MTEQRKVRYQFQVDGRGFGAPIRDRWEDAARDAVNDGYATCVSGGIALGDDASIARIFGDGSQR